MDLRERARKLKTDIPAVFLVLKDGGTPMRAKLCAGIAVAYALSPIDLVPDFIPVLGYLDDVILLPALVALAVAFVPDEVMGRCRAEAEALQAEGVSKKWYYAIPVVLVWALIGWMIVRAIWL